MKKLKISFDRERLHSSITCAMRTISIPRDTPGYDLIRGVVFGMIDHPEYNLEEAINRSVEMTRLPFLSLTVQDAIEEMKYSIEGSKIKNEELESAKKSGESDIEETESDTTDTEVIHKILKKICKSVKVDFYRTTIINFLRKHGYSDRSIEFELLYNMIFKKMIDKQSTEKCMIIYAYRKTFVKEPTSYSEAEKTVKEYIDVEDCSLEEFIGRKMDEIFLKNY